MGSVGGIARGRLGSLRAGPRICSAVAATAPPAPGTAYPGGIGGNGIAPYPGGGGGGMDGCGGGGKFIIFRLKKEFGRQ